jgi:hypothetical protein
MRCIFPTTLLDYKVWPRKVRLCSFSSHYYSFVLLNQLVTRINEHQHVVQSQYNFRWRIQHYGVGWYTVLIAKQCKIFALLFSEVLSQISLTFKNCCIPGLYSNASNKTSALLARLVVYAYRTVPTRYPRYKRWCLYIRGVSVSWQTTR